MMITEHDDAVIIGADQAGVPLSSALADAGWKTAIKIFSTPAPGHASPSCRVWKVCLT
jgi:hypothetical protein